MEQVTFFATRTLARAAAVDGAKFKDMGADSPKGERWAVITEVQPVQEVKEVQAIEAVKPAPLQIPEGAVIVAAAPRETLKSPRKPTGKVHGKGFLTSAKRQKVETIFKRNKTTVMIAAAIRGM